MARATSCHRPSSPQPPARPESLGQGSAERGRPRFFQCPTPLSPTRERPSRAPRSPPGDRHVAEPGARPPEPAGTHSGAAAAPASWGLSGLPAPRPAPNPMPCRASVRPAGSQPSRAQERSQRRPQLPAAWRRAARTWALGARGRPGGAARAARPLGRAGRGRGPPRWPRPCAQPALPAARREAQLGPRVGVGAGGLGVPLARLTPLSPGRPP